jgi:hypothetical protein
MINAWQSRTLQANRILLKHFRVNQLDGPFNSLIQALSVLPEQPEHILEHPILTRLFDTLVRKGDFQESETIVGEIIAAHMVHKRALRPTSCKLRTFNAQGSRSIPCTRSDFGAAKHGDRIYLYGGSEYLRIDTRYRVSSSFDFIETKEQTLDDFWTVELRDNEVIWQQVGRENPDHLWPPAMAGQQIVASQDHV